MLEIHRCDRLTRRQLGPPAARFIRLDDVRGPVSSSATPGA